MVAAACWAWLPGTALDEKAFDLVVRGFANPPFFVSGSGKQADPWKLRTFESTAKTDARHAPIVVSLDDDLEGFFQSSPPSPVDLAVIFSNLQRLGVKNASASAVLAWSDPDPIGLVALDKVISRFDSVVMAAPLSRGAVPEAMPDAFRNASLPMSAIQGNTAELPLVNRIPIPGVILGRANSLAGFQVLESEKGTGFTPLLARWDDRVVFAFPLLTVMRHLDLPIEGMEIRLGEYLKLSPQGPTVPIDSFGRLGVPLKSLPALQVIRAEALIDAEEDAISPSARGPLVLRDDRSAAEPSTRAFSRQVAAMIAAISSDAGLSDTRAYRRLPLAWETFLLLLPVWITLGTGRLPSFPRHIVFLIFGGLLIAAQVLAAGSAHAWLPGLACMASALTGWFAGRPGEKIAAVSVAPESIMALEPEPVEPIPDFAPPPETPPPTMDPVDEAFPETLPPKKKTARKKPAAKTTEKKTTPPKSPAPKKSATPKKEPAKKKTPKADTPPKDPSPGKKRKN